MVPELDLRKSALKLRDLEKAKRSFTKKDFVPGNLLFLTYDAKNKDLIYDRRPMILILRFSRTHTLGLNFHWLPYKKRIELIKEILKENELRIKEGKKLRFNYIKLKPFLKRNSYIPCVRVYINKRIFKSGVVIPPERLIEVARIKTESFTGMSSHQLFRMMKNGSKRFRLHTK